MLGHVKPRERLFDFLPSKQERFRAFFNAESVNARDLNSEFVWVSGIATVGQVPDVAKDNDSLIATDKRQLERMLRRQNNRVPPGSFDRCDDSLKEVGAAFQRSLPSALNRMLTPISERSMQPTALFPVWRAAQTRFFPSSHWSPQMRIGGSCRPIIASE